MFKLILTVLVASTNAFLPVVRPSNNKVGALNALSCEGNVGRRAFVSTSTIVIPTLAWTSAASASDAEATDLISTPSGLKYRVLKEGGTGPKIQRTQKVSTMYMLWLDGFDGKKQIDSSRGFGKGPFAFNAGVGQVIRGWDEAVMDMKVGEQRQLVVPAALGYGAAGAGGRIPGGSTLYFDVQIVSAEQPIVLNEKQKQWLEEHPF